MAGRSALCDASRLKNPYQMPMASFAKLESFNVMIQKKNPKFCPLNAK